MADYSEVPTLIGRMKRAAIDCYMLEQELPHRIDGEDKYYYEGSGRGMKQTVDRPGPDGEGGGTVRIEGWFDWGLGDNTEAFQSAFDTIRGNIDSLFENLLDLPDGTTLINERIYMMDAAEELTPGGADATPKPGGGSSLDLNNIELSARVNNIYGLSYRLSSLTINAFRTAYADRLGGVLDGQAALAATLGMSAAGQAAVFEQLRKSVAGFASDGVESLNELAARLGNGAGGSPVGFIIGGAVFSVASLLTSGTAAVALGSIGAAGGLIGDLWPEPRQPKEVRFEGDSLDSMLTNMQDVRTQMLDETREDEMVIQDALRAANNAILSSRPTFDVAEPDYPASGPGQEGIDGPGTIEQDTSDMQQMAGSCEIVSDIVSGARDKIVNWNGGGGDWSRPTGVGVGTQGPYADFNSLANNLSSILRNTSNEMGEAATKLIEASLDFQATDEEVESTLDREVRELGGVTAPAGPPGYPPGYP